MTKTFASKQQAEAFYGCKIVGLAKKTYWLPASDDVFQVTIANPITGTPENWYAAVNYAPVNEAVAVEEVIPENVVERVQAAIARINRDNADFKNIKQFDAKMGGSGRYEWDWWLNRRNGYGVAMYTIETFVKHAKEKSIDADLWLRKWGFNPPIEVSSAAQEWA